MQKIYLENTLGSKSSFTIHISFSGKNISVTEKNVYSEGITGYEVQTSGLYGMVTGIAEESLYIDVDDANKKGRKNHKWEDGAVRYVIHASETETEEYQSDEYTASLIKYLLANPFPVK